MLQYDPLHIWFGVEQHKAAKEAGGVTEENSRAVEDHALAEAEEGLKAERRSKELYFWCLWKSNKVECNAEGISEETQQEGEVVPHHEEEQEVMFGEDLEQWCWESQEVTLEGGSSRDTE